MLYSKRNHRFYVLVFISSSLLLSIIGILIQPFARLQIPQVIFSPADLTRLSQSFYLMPNRGQSTERIRYMATIVNGWAGFTANGVETIFTSLQGYSYNLRTSFIGSNLHSTMIATDPTPTQVNIFRGNDPTKYARNIPTYSILHYQQLYNGIDLHYDSPSGNLRRTYLLNPGADPSLIRWQYEGVSQVNIDTSGALVLSFAQSEDAEAPFLRELPPVAWQTIDGTKQPVEVAYNLRTDGSIGFQVGNYNQNESLVIDPELIFSSFVGGSSFDLAKSVAVDNQNNIYVVGNTASVDFTVVNPIQPEIRSIQDVFIGKYSPTGTLLFATYLGGDRFDEAYDIDVDAQGNAYITGSAAGVSPSQNPFPTTLGAYDRTEGPIKGFVAKISSSGEQLLYSTFFGGSFVTVSHGIAVDSSNNAYIAGEVRNNTLPVRNAFQINYGGGTNDAFVAKISDDGGDLIYASYLGGRGNDINLEGMKIGVDVDGNGSLYIASTTTSDMDFPITDEAFDTTFEGFSEAYVAKITPGGEKLAYATYLGGNGVADSAYGLVVTDNGEAYVVGSTTSADFPVTPGSYQTIKGVAGAAFITQLNTNGSGLVFSTFYGGDGDFAYDVALDKNKQVHVVGLAQGINLPQQNPIQARSSQREGFVATFSPNGNQLLFGSYLGGTRNEAAFGVAAANDSTILVVGGTRSDDFPTLNAAQSNYGGSVNDNSNQAGFVLKVRPSTSTIYIPFSRK